MNCYKIWNYTSKCIILIVGLSLIILSLCLMIFGCNNPMLYKLGTKKISTRVFTSKYNMLSQDCLFTEVISGELCVDSGINSDVIENGKYIENTDSKIDKYVSGDEFCLSIKNTNVVYSCKNEHVDILITPTLFNSTSRVNNVSITIYLALIGIFSQLIIICLFCHEIVLLFMNWIVKKCKENHENVKLDKQRLDKQRLEKQRLEKQHKLSDKNKNQTKQTNQKLDKQKLDNETKPIISLNASNSSNSSNSSSLSKIVVQPDNKNNKINSDVCEISLEELGITEE